MSFECDPTGNLIEELQMRVKAAEKAWREEAELSTRLDKRLERVKTQLGELLKHGVAKCDIEYILKDMEEVENEQRKD